MRKSALIICLLPLMALSTASCEGCSDGGANAKFEIDPDCEPDSDGDGICDAQEIELGTDPDNPEVFGGFSIGSDDDDYSEFGMHQGAKTTFTDSLLNSMENFPQFLAEES